MLLEFVKVIVVHINVTISNNRVIILNNYNNSNLISPVNEHVVYFIVVNWNGI